MCAADGRAGRIDRRFETGLAAQQGAGSRIERRRSAAFGNDAVRHATVIVDGQKRADDSALILLCGAGRIVTGLKGQVQKPGWLREGGGLLNCQGQDCQDGQAFPFDRL